MPAKTNHRAWKLLSRRLDMNRYHRSHMDQWDILLGDGHTQPEDIALGETNDGLGVILGSPCRNERACIGVTHGHFAAKGRGDRCVLHKTAYTKVVGARDAELPLRGGHGGLRCGHLCRG